MLAYFLALAVGLGSFSIYMAAFFFPEVHRKSDFVWSGVGLFYALILWACAGRITGALLLGQMAGVALLGWLAWETLSLRRQVTPIAQQTPIPESANLKGIAGGSFSTFFGKKKDAAPKKPKFVRSNKPKAEVVATPVPDTGEVKLEEQSATPPVAELISESSIAPELPVSDSIAPATEPIPVWSIKTPVTTETSPAPAESAPGNETLLPLEVSEIATAATVEPAKAQSEVKQQQELDEFGEIEAELTAPGQESQAAVSPTAVSPTAVSPTAVSPTPPKVSKKSAGFGSLFGNIKNSIGGFLGRGSDKSTSDPTPQTPIPKVPPTAEPVAEIATIPTPDIDQILESELASVTVEIATETSSTAVEESQGVPFPPDVEAMAELIATETASSPKIAETPIEPSETETQTSPETLEQPPAQVVELTETVDIVEPKIPTPPEMTAVEVVSAAPAEIEGSGDSIDSSAKQEVETISVDCVSIEPTDDEPSQNAEKPQLISPNSSDPDIVEAAKPAAESKSENISSEQPPTT